METNELYGEVGDMADKIKLVEYATDFVLSSKRREIEKMDILGEYNPATDRRSMCREAEEELYDVLSYMRFLERKHPDLKDDILRVKKVAFEAYCLLRALEKKEETMDRVKAGVGIESS